MTREEAIKKYYIGTTICHLADKLFTIILQEQTKSKELFLDDIITEDLWDMTLRDIAHVLDTINPSGGSLPEDCRDILS